MTKCIGLWDGMYALCRISDLVDGMINCLVVYKQDIHFKNSRSNLINDQQRERKLTEEFVIAFTVLCMYVYTFALWKSLVAQADCDI